MDEAAATCTRIAILVGGSFACLGTQSQLKSEYGSDYELHLVLDMDKLLDAATVTSNPSSSKRTSKSSQISKISSESLSLQSPTSDSGSESDFKNVVSESDSESDFRNVVAMEPSNSSKSGADSESRGDSLSGARRRRVTRKKVVVSPVRSISKRQTLSPRKATSKSKPKILLESALARDTESTDRVITQVLASLEAVEIRSSVVQALQLAPSRLGLTLKLLTEKKKFSIASVFRWCEENPLGPGAVRDYELKEPTLSDVFLRFAAEHARLLEAEDYEVMLQELHEFAVMQGKTANG